MYFPIVRYQRAALSVVLQTEIHNLSPNMSFFIFFNGVKKFITKKSTLLRISTRYHLWMNFKTKNHEVCDLVFWLQAPKQGEIRLSSPMFHAYTAF